MRSVPGKMLHGSAIPLSSRGGDTGFTLLELLVTLTIAASIAAILLPAFSRALDRMNAAAAARSLASCMREARYEAIMQARVVAVVLAPDSPAGHGSFYCGGAWRDPRVELRIAGERVTRTADGHVLFYPWGGSSGGEIELELAGRRFAVDVDWFSGTVRTRG